MCGIAGFVNANGDQADRSILEAMNQAMAHRGPDDDGFYVDQNVGLAMRRLAIIDVAGGKQPIHNADKTKWIVFNGEIYNYQSLRDDIEKPGHRFY
jgi:asparagine synthase (glutamine-hydrolysing)